MSVRRMLCGFSFSQMKEGRLKKRPPYLTFGPWIAIRLLMLSGIVESQLARFQARNAIALPRIKKSTMRDEYHGTHSDWRHRTCPIFREAALIRYDTFKSF